LPPVKIRLLYALLSVTQKTWHKKLQAIAWINSIVMIVPTEKAIARSDPLELRSRNFLIKVSPLKELN
jgi:hypothetical protein